ncbi:MAG TPA: Ig-like domain-containing protein [Tepidisphaeraceae bacterium]|nr:Ig-like domain-containing protein [Tepidisphaeraceae bacterium]
MIAEALEPRRLFSTLTVNTLSDATSPGAGLLTLRQAVAAANAAAGSDTINFSPTLFQAATLQTIGLTQGEIDLTDTHGTTTIIGPGAGLLEISGNAASRIFGIDPNVTAQIGGVTVAQGLATFGVDNRYDGGGIYNQGALTLVDSTVTGNAANGETPGSGYAASHGGGIDSTGTLVVQDSLFSANTAYGAGYSNTPTSTNGQGFTGAGGAIYSSGPVTITGSTLTGNSATGGAAPPDGAGGEGIGGAIYATGTLQISNSTLSQNQATGTGGVNGGPAGSASGGAIFSADSATLVAATVTGNTAAGGSNYGIVNGAAYGGGIFATGSLTITSSTISLNTAVSGNSQYSSGAEEADGGGVYSGVNDNTGVGTLTLIDSTVSGNMAIGGDGVYYATPGAAARGGGVFAQIATITASAITGNGAAGGSAPDNNSSITIDGAAGGNAEGGGVWLGMASTVTDSTLAANTAVGGKGGDGSSAGGTASGGMGGDADGGAIYTNASLQIFDSTVSGNMLSAGQGGYGTAYNVTSPPVNPGTANGGGLFVAADPCVLTNTIISANNAMNPSATALDDISGAVQNTSADNLIGEGGGLIDGVNGNRVGVDDPLLGALANNGGPTQTLFPQTASPAIDAGSNALVPGGVTTDQRGLARISDGVVDIGAVEIQVAPTPSITLMAPADQTATVNQSAAVSLGSFAQTGASAPFMLDVKWGDGSPDSMIDLATVGPIPPATHVFSSSGPITVTESVSDSIGTISNTASFSEAVSTGALPASALAFTSAPTTAAAGSIIGAVVVAVQDMTGATVTSDSSLVTLTLGGGATFSDGKTAETATASLGDAAFNNLIVNAAGAYTLTATDASLTPATSALTITPVLSLANTTVTVVQPTVPLGDTDTITLQAMDRSGNIFPSATLVVAFSVVSGSGSSAGTIGPVAYAGNGAYTATFTATALGTPILIAATIGGAAVTSAMPMIAVTTGALDPATSTIAVSTPALGAAATITFQAKDSAGDNLSTGGASVVFTLSGAVSSTLAATDNGDGTYTAAFTPSAPGVLHIAATVNGAAVTSSVSPVIPSLSATIVLPAGFSYKAGRAVTVKLRNLSDTLVVNGPFTIQLALSASADGSNPLDVGTSAVVKPDIRAGRTISGHATLGALPAGLDPSATYYLVAQVTSGGISAGQGVSAPVVSPASITVAVHAPIRVKPGKTVSLAIRLINNGYSPITGGTIDAFFFSASSDGSAPAPASAVPATVAFAIPGAKVGGRPGKKTMHTRLSIPTTMTGTVFLFATVSDAATTPPLIAVLATNG